jgi:hypothetical protein
MARGYWLTRVGGLAYGDKVWGDTELTKFEYDALFDFAPEHRHVALPILRREPEYEAAAEAQMHAVVAEVSASDEADKARAAYEAFKVAHAAAAQLDPNAPDAPKIELDAAKALADETAAKYQAAAAAQLEAAAKLEEMRALMVQMPPRRTVAA